MLRKTRIWKTLGATTLRQGPAAVPLKGKRPTQIMSNRTADKHNGSAGQVGLIGGRIPEKAALVTAEAHDVLCLDMGAGTKQAGRKRQRHVELEYEEEREPLEQPAALREEW